MKTAAILFLALFILHDSVAAQSPQGISYQAVVRDVNSQLVTDTDVSVRVSILPGSVNGDPVLIETHSTATNENGLLALVIGSGVPETGTLSSINWGDGPYFLKTEIDPDGGSDYSIVATTQLLSVPYALYAETAGNTSAASFTHYIGELYDGGIVVAVWKVAGAEHGLIASLADLSSATTWSNVTNTLIGTTAHSPRDGQANTNAIINQPGHLNSAAKICDDYSADGFGDWYLPSAWELSMCYNSATIVNEVLGDDNGFKWDTYWSSTETDNTGAWTQFFYYGYSFGYPKSDIYRVRAVRRF